MRELDPQFLIKRSTYFFSNKHPGALFKELTRALQKLTQRDPQLNAPHWRFVFEAEKTFIDEEQQDNSNQEPYKQQALIQAEIKKVKDQERYAIEFTRKSGNNQLFYKEVKKYFEEMVAFNDSFQEEASAE